jgi:SAM-dependent methyltransferase
VSDLAGKLEGTAPLPPRGLAIGAGASDRGDLISSYRAVGRDARATILEALGESWSFAGRRVLDFGCGTGEVMRHFLAEARDCELGGCDVDEHSVDWINAELNPPLSAFATGAAPPLDQPSEFFDLIWSMSAFTHMSDHWADWLAELHRVLKPGGQAIISVLGGAMYEAFNDEEWDPDRIGMTVLDHGHDADLGGQRVFHAPWWLREHWGRAFEIVHVREGRAPREHGVVLLRRRSDVEVTPQLLEAIDAAREPREVAALRWQVHVLQREASVLRSARDALAVAEARRLPRRVAGHLGQTRRRDG